ncbi:MAG: HAMP domain-containing histidine kinase [Cyclobacteriaceae bacterium]
MGFKRFQLQVIGRVALLVLTMYLLASVIEGETSFLTKGLLIGVIIYQIYNLFQYLDRSNREVIGFLKSIQYDDFTHTYPKSKTGSMLDELNNEFNTVIRKFREIRAEKEAQYQYLKTIVQHVGIGIITFDKDGEVQIFNAAARRLLGVNQIKNVYQLKAVSEALITSINELRTGGRDLIRFIKNGEEVQIAVYIIELSLRGKEFKLVSLQNIQSELEEKEMEAWQNLIRVLTHEIMNSVTPISSLAATVESELDDFLKSGNEVSKIGHDTIEDFHLALKTIHNRSDSLITFVSDFRNMTRIKHPALRFVPVCEVMEHVCNLLKFEIEENDVAVNLVVPDDLMFNMDREQIEQVLINLVKNAIQAVGENEEIGKDNRQIDIVAKGTEEGGGTIVIKDNGTGIDEDAIKKIFIPFFTTKKHGSGIGLSLSKQIMRMHHGSISVQSAMNVGTEFTLRFNS